MSDDNAETGLAKAERRIAACRDSRSEKLDLSRLGLNAVPESLLGLTWLKRLNLRNNQIGPDGARALAALTGLTALNLSYNQIGDEGAQALAALTGLTALNLSGNGAIDLRPLMSLRKLERIELDKCKFPTPVRNSGFCRRCTAST